MKKVFFASILLCITGGIVTGQEMSSERNTGYGFLPDTLSPVAPKGYRLTWADEFDVAGKPDERFWSFENGFVRNEELQWYQPQNVKIENGLLVIEGRRERVKNIHFSKGSRSWRENREFAEYTSACVNTKHKFEFQYGIMEVRARIDTAMGMWPAIWTLGVDRPWPSNGEVDQMEFYRIDGEPTILANAAWASNEKRAEWDSEKIPFSKIAGDDPAWTLKFHTWKMEWTENFIRLYLDEKLLNEIDLMQTVNPDGFNPFHQPQFILLNLAIGSNGGDPSHTGFPRWYEVDYVRVFQKNNK